MATAFLDRTIANLASAWRGLAERAGLAERTLRDPDIAGDVVLAEVEQHELHTGVAHEPARDVFSREHADQLALADDRQRTASRCLHALQKAHHPRPIAR